MDIVIPVNPDTINDITNVFLLNFFFELANFDIIKLAIVTDPKYTILPTNANAPYDALTSGFTNIRSIVKGTFRSKKVVNIKEICL